MYYCLTSYLHFNWSVFRLDCPIKMLSYWRTYKAKWSTRINGILVHWIGKLKRVFTHYLVSIISWISLYMPFFFLLLIWTHKTNNLVCPVPSILVNLQSNITNGIYFITLEPALHNSLSGPISFWHMSQSSPLESLWTILLEVINFTATIICWWFVIPALIWDNLDNTQIYRCRA